MYKVALYIRLSKEDENSGYSESIKNQRMMLLQYVEEHGYEVVDIYIDDGYSGVNFDRPEFKRMIDDILDNKINMVITKDMSRLGRDYIETGNYIEKWFPEHHVRYVAIGDNIDTIKNDSNTDIAPFKAIMNDYYAKDISKKIRSSLHAKQKEGKWVGGCPPFGYRVSPDDKNHLEIYENEAYIVKKIFSLALEGKSTYSIREELIRLSIPTPSMIRGKRGNKSNETLKGIWNTKTIHGILTNRIYTGDLVQNKRNRLNYKSKKIIIVPKDDWIIYENAHEALVSKEDFITINKMLKKSTNKPNKKNTRLLDGLLTCYECQHRISICSPRRNNRSYIVCNNYRMNSKLKVCTSHGFSYDKIESDIIDIIRNIIIDRVDYNNILNRVVSKLNKNKDRNNRIKELEYLIKNNKNKLERIYKDLLDDTIDKGMYEKIRDELLENNKECETRLNILNKEEDITFERCMKLLKEKDIDRELIIKLIDRIDVHDDKLLDIYFAFSK